MNSHLENFDKCKSNPTKSRKLNQKVSPLKSLCHVGELTLVSLSAIRHKTFTGTMREEPCAIRVLSPRDKLS